LAIPSTTLSAAVLERFRKRVRNTGQLHLARSGQWESTSWFEIGKRATSLAAGMHLLGVGRGDPVAVVGPVGAEGSVALIASVLLGAKIRLVPDEECLPSPATGERCPLVMTGSRAVVGGLEAAGHGTSASRRIIGWGGASSVAGVLPLGQLCMKGADVLEREGRSIHHLPESVRSDDVLLMVPRSESTTGQHDPLSLTQRNCLCATQSLIRALGIQSTDRLISLLPADGYLERSLIGWSALLTGASEVQIDPPTAGWLEVLGTSAPTVLFTTGDTLDALMRDVERQLLVGSAWQRRASAWAVRVGIEAARRRLSDSPMGAIIAAGGWLADVAVLAQVRRLLGGALRTIVVWPGTMQRATRWFFEAARLSPLGLFGRPESSGIGLMEPIRAPRPGSYGWPMPYTETRIDDQGMLYTRGPHVVAASKRDRDAGTNGEAPWLPLGLSGDRDDEGYFWPERAFGALDAPSLAVLPIASSIFDDTPRPRV
jgi:long-chain acyl-CoA synthetase